MKFMPELLICIALLWACMEVRSVVAEDADAVDCSVTYSTSVEQIATCRAAAESGDVNAQFGLGFMYDEFGMGVVPMDYSEAMKWYRRAAEQGHAKTQIQIGFMYERGNGVPKNETEAVAWFRRAAEQGRRGGAVQAWPQVLLGRGCSTGLCPGGSVVSPRR